MNAEHKFLCDIAEKVSMPDVYLSVRSLLDKSDTKIGDYVALLQTDAMLAIRIIRIANSEFFGGKRKADDLYDAISLIGTLQLHDFLLTCLCIRAFSNIPAPLLDSRAFWRHSIECGIACRTLAKLCGLAGGNRFFTLGLLLEIGHAAMFIKAPELALDALLDSQENNVPLAQAERQVFGFDYCQLGAELMQLWHLPEVYSHIIGHHLTPDTTDPVYCNDTYLVHLAQQLLQAPDRVYGLLSELQNKRPEFAAIPDELHTIVSHQIAEHSEQVFLMLCPPNLLAEHPANGNVWP